MTFLDKVLHAVVSLKKLHNELDVKRLKKKALEQTLAKEFANLRKEVVGKGPEDCQVYIHQDSIYIKVKGLWSPTEIVYLTYMKKRNILSDMQNELIQKAYPFLVQLLERYISLKILDISVKAFLEYDQAHAILLLDGNLEKLLKQE